VIIFELGERAQYGTHHPGIRLVDYSLGGLYIVIHIWY
jgi:hypothetical protein